MKILVIFTGGTIASVTSDGWLSPDKSQNQILLEKYKNTTGDFATEFDSVEPFVMLSENLSGDELNMMISSVKENIGKEYDGIIITHGSDTIAYSTAALGYAFADADIPIVFVCSAYSLDDERENGTINFTAAVEFIRAKAGKGVFASYKNDNDNLVNIHNATRLVLHREGSADICSIDTQPYAFYDTSIQINKNYKQTKRKGTQNIHFVKSPKILVIDSRPGDSYDYRLEGVQSVIFKPYHSGTLNTSNEGLKLFCEKARRENIPLLLVNVKEGDRYVSARMFDDLGIAILPFCTFAAVYVKCWLALSMGAEVIEFLSEERAEEFLH